MSVHRPAHPIVMTCEDQLSATASRILSFTQIEALELLKLSSIVI
jgi:hypothetical protein